MGRVRFRYCSMQGSGKTIWGMEADGSHLYWADLWTDEIRRIPLLGGASELVSTTPSARDLTVGGGDVFWSDWEIEQIRQASAEKDVASSVAVDGGTDTALWGPDDRCGLSLLDGSESKHGISSCARR